MQADAYEHRLGRGRRAVLVGCAVAAALGVAVHLGTIFFFVAPPNPVNKEYRTQIDGWIFPWFEQHWALFAPDPFMANYTVAVRTRGGDGRVGGWTDLSAVDWAAMRGNPYPSRANQNMLRRAWKVYRARGDLRAPAGSERAELFRRYLQNIAAGRLEELGTEPYEAMQLRVTTEPVPPPRAEGAAAGEPSHLRLPWWEARA